MVSSFLMGSLCISLTSPATLEHLKFYIKFRGRKAYYNEFYNSLHHSDVWSYLDSIITIPTGSRLQRVDIDIDYICRDDDSDVGSYEDEEGEDYASPDEGEMLDAVLENLPLLRTKGILFVDVFEGV